MAYGCLDGFRLLFLVLCLQACAEPQIALENHLQGQTFTRVDREQIVALARQTKVKAARIVGRYVGHPHPIPVVRVYSAWVQRGRGVVQRQAVSVHHREWVAGACGGRATWCLEGGRRGRWVERAYRLSVGGKLLTIRVDDGHLPGAAEVTEVEELLRALVDGNIVSSRRLRSPFDDKLPLFAIARTSTTGACSRRWLRSDPPEPPGYVLKYGNELMGEGLVVIKQGGRWHHLRSCGWTA